MQSAYIEHASRSSARGATSRGDSFATAASADVTVVWAGPFASWLTPQAARISGSIRKEKAQRMPVVRGAGGVIFPRRRMSYSPGVLRHVASVLFGFLRAHGGRVQCADRRGRSRVRPREHEQRQQRHERHDGGGTSGPAERVAPAARAAPAAPAAATADDRWPRHSSERDARELRAEDGVPPEFGRLDAGDLPVRGLQRHVSFGLADAHGVHEGRRRRMLVHLRAARRVVRRNGGRQERRGLRRAVDELRAARRRLHGRPADACPCRSRSLLTSPAPLRRAARGR